MNFLDSWVWLEFLSAGDQAGEVEKLIERADTPEEGGLVTPTVIAEVSYRVRVVEDEETAENAVRAICSYEHIESIPLVDEIGEYAAELRFKYYQRRERELSYADAIHVATAAIHDECHTLHSGDPDFEDIEEVDTVVL